MEPTSPGSPQYRIQRAVLLELLTDAPPAGNSISALAVRLHEDQDNVRAAAAALAAAGLAEIEHDVVIATTAAAHFDALWPITIATGQPLGPTGSLSARPAREAG